MGKSITGDLDKLRFLKAFMPKEHVDVYKKMNNFDDGVSYEYRFFVPFCHAYSEFLLVNGSLSLYGEFVEHFNRLLEGDETHKIIVKIQEQQINDYGALAFLNTNYNEAFLEDKRPSVKGRDFEREADLENIMASELTDFFGEGVKIKRQQKHGYGTSDITINDLLTIELKRNKARRMNVYQAFEYSFDESIESICLLASSFDDKTLAIANRLGISCYSYSFMYEEGEKQYPIGFVVEKVNETKSNELDEYLEAMDACFWISFYDPAFNFKEVYLEKVEKVNSILELTNKVQKENEKKLLSALEKEGYDTSKGLKHVLMIMEAETSKS